MPQGVPIVVSTCFLAHHQPLRKVISVEKRKMIPKKFRPELMIWTMKSHKDETAAHPEPLHLCLRDNSASHPIFKLQANIFKDQWAIILKMKNEFVLLEMVWNKWYLQVQSQRIGSDTTLRICHSKSCWPHLMSCRCSRRSPGIQECHCSMALDPNLDLCLLETDWLDFEMSALLSISCSQGLSPASSVPLMRSWTKLLCSLLLCSV